MAKLGADSNNGSSTICKNSTIILGSEYCPSTNWTPAGNTIKRDRTIAPNLTRFGFITQRSRWEYGFLDISPRCI
jgi:hypothetical protein